MRERYVEIERKTTAKRIILYFFQLSFMPKKIEQNRVIENRLKQVMSQKILVFLKQSEDTISNSKAFY